MKVRDSYFITPEIHIFFASQTLENHKKFTEMKKKIKETNENENEIKFRRIFTNFHSFSA